MTNPLNANWFTEVCDYGGSAFSLKLKENGHIHHEKSEFQSIDIYDTEKYGKLMVIDGFTMVTSLENFIYHEMMAHLALFSHPEPKKVVVIGGGDCGTLREVLRHDSVEKAWQIEIDERVTRLSEEHFPELCESNNDSRAELLFADGIKWIAEADTGSIDVIIVDSTDPVGPAEGLFNEAFFKQCYRVLSKQGILVQQGESPLIHMKLIKEMHDALKNAGFQQTKVAPFPQPIYPTGFWSATLVAKNLDLDTFREEAAMNKSFSTKYYNAGIHKGALATPQFILDSLD